MRRVVLNDAEFSSHESLCLETLSRCIECGNMVVGAIDTALNEGIQDELISKRLGEKAQQLEEALRVIQSIQELYAGRAQSLSSSVESADHL